MNKRLKLWITVSSLLLLSIPSFVLVRLIDRPICAP